MRYFQPLDSADPTAGYVNGNPDAGIEGSIPDARGFEQLMRELVACINAAGLTPSEFDTTQVMQAVRGGALSFFPDGGTTNQLIITPKPGYISYFVGMKLTVRPSFPNTGPATINVNGIGPQNIVRKGATPLSGGEWSLGDVIELTYNGTAFQLTGGGNSSGGANFAFKAWTKAGTYPWVVPVGVNVILAETIGGGAAGAGVANATSSGAGGGAGGYAKKLLQVNAGQVLNLVVGAGAPRTAPGANTGGNGGTSSFDTYMSATGGTGGTAVANGFAPGKSPGGMGIGGDLNWQGGQGRSGFAIGSVYYGGDGGAPYYSGENPFTQGGYHDGFMPGMGGAGASSAGGPLAGSAGFDGAHYITCLA